MVSGQSRRFEWLGIVDGLPDWWFYAIIAAICFLVRLPTFGNPMLEYDEQLYLVIGDRLLHGQLPYLDVWDRKPIGLFLFYAGVRLLGGSGIVQYQCAATVCVTITCWVIWTIVRRGSGVIPALISSVSYVLILNILTGEGGQSPVIYNALTACSALAAFRSNDTRSIPRIIGLALLAMLLMGLAIQCKYTPMVEGSFLGCWFLWRLWQVGMPVPRLIGTALVMIAVAVLPTAAVAGYYASIGHFDAFVQANFVSIFQRKPFPVETRTAQMKLVLVKAICVTGPAPFALVLRWRQRHLGHPGDFWLLAGWTVFALIGFGMLGDFYDFYFITVLLPLCIVVAPLIRPGRAGFVVVCMLCLWPLMMIPRYYFRTAEFKQAAQQLTEAISPYVAHRCLYIYDGPTILYMLTHACASSRYIYPDHLTNPTETPALGVVAAQEEKRLLATRPGAIVTADRPLIPQVDRTTQQLVREALEKDYVLVARVSVVERVIYVWALRDLHPRTVLPSPPRGMEPE